MSARMLALLLPFLAAAQENGLREAVRLDQQQKCGEAEHLYVQMLGQGPPTSPLLNNAGNHYLICGDPEKARTLFERLLKVNPQHANANLQLARIATEQHQGARALNHLARVNENSPPIRMLRAEAIYWAGQHEAAFSTLDEIHRELATTVDADPSLDYLLGMTCARLAAYDRAVTAFTAALAKHPNDYEVLFNLGRAAARAKLYDRAIQALDVALKLQPGNVDALVELAGANIALHDYARGVYLLVKAGQSAPDRADIQLALAHAAQDGGYYGDAALAYDLYLNLKPADQGAFRDRALARGLTDAGQKQGIRDLRAYLSKHPQDPLGYYYLAQLTWRGEPEPDTATAALESALKLQPKLAAAHVDLAWLLNRQGKTLEAIPHLEKAIAINPEDIRALDQLGMAYLSLDRPADSSKILRKAAAIAASDQEVMMHLGRALMETGHEDEARQILEKFRKAQPAKPRGPWRQGGMIESASLPAAERSRHEIDRLRRESSLHPDDPELQLRLASLLLADSKVDDAEKEFRALLAHNAEARIYRDAGKFLLAYERYPLARDFLQRAAASLPEATLELALAVFSLDGPEAALRILNDSPDLQKTGDFWLLKARLLEAAGQNTESAKVLEQGLAATTTNPKLVIEAVRLLVQQGRKDRALELLTHSANGNADLLLARATLLATMGRNPEAEKALKGIESLWPEWDQPYLVHGKLLETSDVAASKQKFQTAIALGSTANSANCSLDQMLLLACFRP